MTKLRELKRLFVEHKDYQLASFIREIELREFPIGEDEEKMMADANRLTRALSMLGLNVSDKNSFIISKVVEMLIEEKEHFNLRQAEEIKALADKLY